MKNVMIFVIGAFSSGKTQLIRTVSDTFEIGAYSTDKSRPWSYDHGQIATSTELHLHMFGNPGAVPPSLAWELFNYGASMAGFIVMIDSTNPIAFDESKGIIHYIESLEKYPYIIVANKQDKEDAISPILLSAVMDLMDKTIVECVAIEKDSACNVVRELLRISHNGNNTLLTKSDMDVLIRKLL